jgi:uncharacterized membrane protein
MDSDNKMNNEDIKKEFQLERMILFSDAVFAIVITLMAIEIKIPAMGKETTEEIFLDHLRNILPNLLSYTVSFIFIGILWTRHLKMFSVLKYYDNGLILRNLGLLFLVGLFPFCSSLVSRPHHFYSPYYIYFSLVFLCLLSQYLLTHYITVKKPELRISAPNQEDILKDKFLKYTVIAFGVMIALIIFTISYIQDQSFKIYGLYWVFVYALLLRFFRGKMLKKFKH